MSKSPGEEYLATVDRLEPEICSIDAGAFHASAAISLKRIADVMERRENREARLMKRLCP